MQNTKKHSQQIKLLPLFNLRIDVVVEITKSKELRLRARRCNYADDAVIKELSEETILKRLQDAIDIWKSDRNIK